MKSRVACMLALVAALGCSQPGESVLRLALSDDPQLAGVGNVEVTVTAGDQTVTRTFPISKLPITLGVRLPASMRGQAQVRITATAGTRVLAVTTVVVDIEPGKATAVVPVEFGAPGVDGGPPRADSGAPEAGTLVDASVPDGLSLLDAAQDGPPPVVGDAGPADLRDAPVMSGPDSSLADAGMLSPDASADAPLSPDGPGRQYTVEVAFAGGGDGEVQSAPAGLLCPSQCQAPFPEGTELVLTASPKPGSTFSGWSGACTGSGECRLRVDGTKRITARFVGGPGTHVWAARAPYCFGLAANNAGTTALVTHTGGTPFDIGGESLNGALVVRYNADGAGAWGRELAGAGVEGPPRVAVDPGGNLIAVTSFSGTVMAGGRSFTAAGGTDALIVKYKADGALDWAKAVGGTLADRGRAVGVDAAGNIYFAGSFEGTVDLGKGQVTSQSDGLGVHSDYFVIKYDAAGTVMTVKVVGGTGAEGPLYLAVGAGGDHALVGQSSDGVDFGAGLVFPPTGTSHFAVKYTTAGTLVWVKRFGGESFRPVNVAVDGSGNVAVAGDFFGNANLAGASIQGGANTRHGFVARYASASGALTWERHFERLGYFDMFDVTADADGNVVITGETDGVDFGNGVGTSAGGPDMFVTKFSQTGTLAWARLLGTTDSDRGNAAAIGAGGRIHVCGGFATAGFVSSITLGREVIPAGSVLLQLIP